MNIALPTLLVRGRRLLFCSALLALTQVVNVTAFAAEPAPENNGAQVLEAFDRQQVQRVDAGAAISDKKKQLIMFSLGVPLLILLLSTGALGVAMAVFGKQVFVMHMIMAGLTVTLALVHVIVGLVWFYPF
jgi:hypothetical protein